MSVGGAIEVTAISFGFPSTDHRRLLLRESLNQEVYIIQNISICRNYEHFFSCAFADPAKFRSSKHEKSSASWNMCPTSRRNRN